MSDCRARRPASVVGQGLVEYGLVLGLSAALAVLILVVFGEQVADAVQWIAELVEGGR